MRIPTTEARLHQMCDTYNSEFPVGIPVWVALDDGRILDTRTRSEAWVLGGHSVVVMVEGIAGGYSLDRVTPKSQQPDPPTNILTPEQYRAERAARNSDAPMPF